MIRLIFFSLLLIFPVFSACRAHKDEPVERLAAEKPTPEASTQAAPSSVDDSRRNAITRAVQRVSPGVVSINVIKIQQRVRRGPFASDPFFRRFFPEIYRDRRYQEKVKSIGSGFVISRDGYVVTNDHVAGDGTVITVSFHDGKEYNARLVGSDPISDIALLKVDDGGPFHALPLGDSDDILIGEWAIAFGNPFGLFERTEPTVTVGVVSALNRDFGRVEEGRIYQDMIQTDAAINRGNSGGPLCNALGEVIGMNTFIYTGDRYSSGSVGIGFAIPINRIKEIVAGLKSNTIDRDYWIGLSYLPLTPFLAEQMGYEDTRGIYVAQITRNSPADKAGIELGDIIVAINGVTVYDEATVEKAMGSLYLKVGDHLPLKVWREDRYLTIDIILEKRHD
ncbi:MAG: PDZ domain-containing protein [Calditrichaeota bacterium]|nr:MAG: PDZ domain-containing protein [Calditrichota bacterium]